MSGDEATQDLATRIRSRVRDVPDYPQPGVMFRDITPLLADVHVFRAVIEALAAGPAAGVEMVAAVEARGFVLGAPLALACGAGFVPVRKAGKLPNATVSARYDLEYGQAEIQLPSDVIPPGARVLVLDDVLATGGTAAAACTLVEQAGGQVVGVAFLLELLALDGRSRLVGRRVDALLSL